MSAYLEGKCASLYNGNQNLISGSCQSLAYDIEYAKDSNVEQHIFTCSIPENTTTTVSMFYNNLTMDICPEGGWCNTTINRKKLSDYGNLNDTEKTITTNFQITRPKDSHLNMDDDEVIDVCPKINPVELPSESSSEPPSESTFNSSTCNEAPLLGELGYSNCDSILEDNNMVRSFCGVNENGQVTWDEDGLGKFCKKQVGDDEEFLLYKGIDPTNLSCSGGEKAGNHPSYKIVIRNAIVPDVTVFTVLCPVGMGYCNKDGSLNYDNINLIRNNSTSHPFCNNQPESTGTPSESAYETPSESPVEQPAEQPTEPSTEQSAEPPSGQSEQSLEPGD